MRVDVFDTDPAILARQKKDLQALLSHPGENVQRPCAQCDIPCSCSASPTCPCDCNINCSYTPERMSSDPDRFPIEGQIVPLVYSFNVLGVCKPCWSCEGHMDQQSGNSLRTPQVWFYSDSVVYPKLVAELLEQLRFQKKIQNEWCVRILGWGDKLNARFSIIPVKEKANQIELFSM